MFDFICSDCETRFEKLVRSQDAEPVACPSCGKERVQRQFSAFSAPGRDKFDPGKRARHAHMAEHHHHDHDHH